MVAPSLTLRDYGSVLFMSIKADLYIITVYNALLLCIMHDAAI